MGGAEVARIQVDPEMLGEAARRLEQCRSRLTELGSQDDAGNLGDGGLEGEVRATQARIARQVDRATEGVAGMAQMLRGAAYLYRRGDDIVRDSLTVEVA